MVVSNDATFGTHFGTMGHFPMVHRRKGGKEIKPLSISKNPFALILVSVAAEGEA